MTEVTDFYDLADALAMTLHVDTDVYLLEGTGDPTVDLGQFKVKLNLKTISTVVSDDGPVAMLIETRTGNLGLYVTYKPKTKNIEVSPIDLSILPNEGAGYFEADAVQEVETASAMLLANHGMLRVWSKEPKSEWTEACWTAPSSSGATETVQLPS